ncbi:arginine--tRNA ligase [Bacillus gobiensis]|uniref:arginine--tRNA ligase n=1 Tax=Bacillus gobiensis TaxID=1441095 RepID=UPI003D1B6F42
MIKWLAATELAKLTHGGADALLSLIEIPPNEELGDAAFPCFHLAKEKRMAPQQIAAQLAKEWNITGIKANAEGPYVNLTFNKAIYGKMLIDKISEDQFRNIKFGNGKKVIIDMSSPNIAKPFGIGHLRSTVIGNALYHLYKKTGHVPVRVNHLGDWGTQFGKQIAAYKKWGNEDKLNASPVDHLFELYVQFHEEAENDPGLIDEARSWFHKLEKGDQEARGLWEQFVAVSKEEFNDMYRLLGVDFEEVLGESFYNDKMQAVIDELEEKGLLEESDGAMVVKLEEYDLPPCLIIKSDGSSIYATRDLATAIYRHEIMKGEKLLYVVGGEQSLHFKQIFAVLEKMGYEWAKDCFHVSFGLMRLEGKKMSTRRGRVVTLKEVMKQAILNAIEISMEKNPARNIHDQTAKAMGTGAVIFGDLKNDRKNDVNFSLKEALRFEGETGPYLQYTYARIKSLIRKAGEQTDSTAEIKETFFDFPETWRLLKTLSVYPDILKKSVSEHKPSHIAKYALSICKHFNQFYQQQRVLSDDKKEQFTKLAVCRQTVLLLKESMDILGIEAPEEI